ncbi:unnamed protein product [Camellia sinensis]
MATATAADRRRRRHLYRSPSPLLQSTDSTFISLHFWPQEMKKMKVKNKEKAGGDEQVHIFISLLSISIHGFMPLLFMEIGHSRTNLVTIGWLQVKTGDVKGNAELRVELQERRIACEHLTQRALDAQMRSLPQLSTQTIVTGHIISTTIGGKNGEPKQCIQIEDIRNDEWFIRGYVPVKLIEYEDVNMDDVNAVFDGLEEEPVDEPCRNEDVRPLALNAFDLIILSQGLNHSALFDCRQLRLYAASNTLCFPKTSKSGLLSVEVVAQLIGFKTHSKLQGGPLGSYLWYFKLLLHSSWLIFKKHWEMLVNTLRVIYVFQKLPSGVSTLRLQRRLGLHSLIGHDLHPLKEKREIVS